MRQTLKNCKRIVIKVGTATITYPNGRLNLKRIEELAWVLTDLRNRGMDVALVTSGAIGVGAVRMSMPSRPTVTREKQAAAAVGQAMLMQIYHNFFDRYNQTVAQILLTKWVSFPLSMPMTPFLHMKLNFPITIAFLLW